MTVTLTIRENHVAEIRLTAPARRNALSFATLEALVASIGEAERNGARSAILSADGTVFSAGADFRDLTGTAADLSFDEAVGRATSSLRRSRLPIVAAIQGPCLGAAVDLALSADIVVAARSARFEVPATRLGLLYNPAVIALLHRNYPSPAIKQLLLGVPISAENAVTGGLIARAVDDDELMATVNDIAARIGAGDKDAVAATKELLTALDAGPIKLEHWSGPRKRLLDSDARREAIERARKTLSH
ncbi:MAG: hypothetical protein F2681_15120 [Actinobacteria bacterium]|uniref:Unannotated protein n=1 Tax=freshwater metagenome TaxID=449393 RepID=A0A6J6AB30_9ZZZZ|nr:hypothetical protein [Actinomycetota bacterium]MSW78896.1 hypothetical protein [Actinomycetota bacterium]MSX54052.1 hypothetical protein [Actinomycetota bacterium]MSZ84465.1 hypothetical protein [Actinomycetota bacterium]MTB19421.1 hypothetical protein [Actinomycetota bacterium]